ncbi:hypothetical protein Tcan_02902 [Toxocara canis]|uniref:Uncharacterized protein n=1 Tax=Toxocara canis TaxID=6265 RepID=A0A0B2V5R2_TOXCA|nr:hypothetical protein Tcan_02902 [Toxocara canis]
MGLVNYMGQLSRSDSTEYKLVSKNSTHSDPDTQRSRAELLPGTGKLGSTHLATAQSHLELLSVMLSKNEEYPTPLEPTTLADANHVIKQLRYSEAVGRDRIYS